MTKSTRWPSRSSRNSFKPMVWPKRRRPSKRHQQIHITLLVRFIVCHGSEEQQRLHIETRELVRVGPNGFDDSLALHDVWKSVRRTRPKAKIKG